VREGRGRFPLRRLQPPGARRAAARQPARRRRRCEHGARRQPLRDAAAPPRQEPAGEPRVPGAAARRARCLRSCQHRRGRRRTFAADHGRLHRGRKTPAHGLQLQPADQPQLARPPAQRGRGAGARDRPHRRLGLLGAVQPRCAAHRHPLVAHRAGRSQAGVHVAFDAAVPARQRLPVPGRRTGATGSRRSLRAPAGPVRHGLLAGVQGPRRLPHADALGGRGRAGRFFTRRAVATGVGHRSA